MRQGVQCKGLECLGLNIPLVQLILVIVTLVCAERKSNDLQEQSSTFITVNESSHASDFRANLTDLGACSELFAIINFLNIHDALVTES